MAVENLERKILASAFFPRQERREGEGGGEEGERGRKGARKEGRLGEAAVKKGRGRGGEEGSIVFLTKGLILLETRALPVLYRVCMCPLIVSVSIMDISNE